MFDKSVIDSNCVTGLIVTASFW